MVKFSSLASEGANRRAAMMPRDCRLEFCQTLATKLVIPADGGDGSHFEKGVFDNICAVPSEHEAELICEA